MSGYDKSSEQPEANILGDEAIRRSLLGCADPIELAKFEALLMLDDEFERRVYRLELELADDFSFGQLTSEEQRLFNSRFLLTPDRVRELAVSQALRKSVSSESANEVEPVRQPWRRGFFNLFAVDRPFGSAALAVVTLLIFGSLLWLSQKAPPVRLPAISKRSPSPSPEQRFAHPVVSPSPADNVANDRVSSQPQVRTITLQLESSSEHGQTVQVAKGEVVSVRLELLIDVGPSTDAIYRADLLSADGVPVASFSELKVQPGSPPKVVIDLTERMLQSGSYFLDLSQTSAAGTKDAKRYGFVVKQD